MKQKEEGEEAKEFDVLLHVPPMACRCASYALSLSHSNSNSKSSPSRPSSLCRRPVVVLCSITSSTRASYKSLVSEAVRLLGPPARFEASKLEVVTMEDQMNGYSGIIPRTYILSHCDFTANLTLSISNVINLEQLRGWYNKDDVVAEWKKRDGQLGLHIHCYVSGPNLLLELAAEFRYHIFSKEMPLVLEAVRQGDSKLFAEHPELMDSSVWIYFHSSLPKYNRLESWGPLKEAIKADPGQGYLAESLDGSCRSRKWPLSKSVLQSLYALLL